MSVSFLLGGSLGLLAAYQGGVTDQVISRMFDLLLTIPPLLTVLVLLASLGRSPLVIIIIIVGLVFIPWVGRLARDAAQAVVANDYVHTAVAAASHRRWGCPRPG